ncbi:precursor of CEP9-like [Pistacia vera]|uniref:precursor of CEP9-like n=1 Tax=Pistacia vera TaxID=55513 RepID=UPI001263A02A|nr:precursor of CEP9-like [Pistacia vera]
MVESRSMNKCVIIFACIACHAILSAKGRQLKYKEKEETAKQGSQSISLQQNAAGLKEDLQSTKPSVDISSAENTVSMTGEKEIFPPMSFGASATVHQDDFRPTTPGNSPGVGHKHTKEEEDVESKVEGDHSLNGGHSTTGSKDDFRPTTPGHSPGVGHLLSNKSAEPKE